MLLLYLLITQMQIWFDKTSIVKGLPLNFLISLSYFVNVFKPIISCTPIQTPSYYF